MAAACLIVQELVIMVLVFRMKRFVILLLVVFFCQWVHPQVEAEPVIPPVVPWDDTPPGLMSEEQLMLEPISYRLDIPYSSSGHPCHLLDLYLPLYPSQEAVPVIMFLHGGSWIGGDKAEEAVRLMPFLQTGEYAAVSVNYRLAPEARWPAQLHDVKAAIRWVRANAHVFGLDADRIALWGRGAGATLALLAAFTADDPHWEGELGPFAHQGTSVAAVVNYYAASDLLKLISHPEVFDRTNPDSPEAQLLGAPVHEVPRLAFEASAVNHIHEDAPPVLSLHGTADLVVPFRQAELLHEALQLADVPNYLIRVQHAAHGGFPPQADMRVKDFLDKILLRRNVWISTLPLRMIPE